MLYSKEPGEDGPHPGRVCTGITETPEFGEGLYLEIPMAAASRKCLVREDESSTGSDDGGGILTRVKDNKLYVPVGDFDSKYRDYAERAFKKLLRVQEDGLSDYHLTWVTTNESAITERIWRNWDRGERTIRVLRRALSDAPDDVGEQFQKRHFDDRLGWHETTIPRRTVRDELITQLTRSTYLMTKRPCEALASDQDTFVVKPVRELKAP